MKLKILSLSLFFFQVVYAQWISLRPMPTPRQEMPAVLVNRKIYIIGGITTNLLEGFVTKKIEVYDISSNIWKALKDMPAQRHHAAIATIQNKIYVIGGFDNVDFNPVNTLFVYDIQNDNWSQAQKLPIKSGAGDAVTFNNKIYFFGGANKQHTLDTSLMYDPFTNSWTVLQPMPTPREHIAVTVIDSLIYITAGRGSTDADKLLQIYDPKTNTWTNGTPLRTPRSGSDAVTHDHKMYVLGGEGNRAFNEFEEYDPLINSWDSFPRMLHARHGLGCVVLNDTLYAIGGATQPGFAPCAFNDAFVFNSIPTRLLFNKTNKLEVYWQNENELILKIPTLKNTGILSVYNSEGILMYKKEIVLHQPVFIETNMWHLGWYLYSLLIDEELFISPLISGR